MKIVFPTIGHLLLKFKNNSKKFLDAINCIVKKTVIFQIFTPFFYLSELIYLKHILYF